MSASDSRPRAMVLCRTDRYRQQMVKTLKGVFEVDLFEDAYQAIAAMSGGRVYEVLFSEMGDFHQMLNGLIRMHDQRQGAQAPPRPQRNVQFPVSGPKAIAS